MSHLNSKICLSVKGSVYLSLYSDSHRKWSSVLNTIGLLFPSKTLFESGAAVAGTTVFQISWCGGCFSLLTLVSACSQLVLLLHFPHSLLCKSPIWAIRTAIYAGFLLLHAQPAAQCFHRTHSCGCLSGGRESTPWKWQPARDARENIRGDTW